MNRPQRREVGRALAFLQKGDTHPTLVCLRRLASHERWLGARLRLAREVRRTQLVLDLPLPPVPSPQVANNSYPSLAERVLTSAIKP